MRQFAVAAVLSVALPAVHAHAEAAGAAQFTATQLLERIAACAAKSDTAARTACYDGLAAAVVPAPTAGDDAEPARAPTTGATAGKAAVGALSPEFPELPLSAYSSLDLYAWASEVGKVGGLKQATIAMSSAIVLKDREVVSRMRATLMIRCYGDLSAWVSFEDNKFFDASRAIPVAVRFDDNAPDLRSWVPSVSGASVGLWKREHALSFLRELGNSRHFAFRAKTVDGYEVTALFRVAGLKDAIKPVSALCRF